MKKTLVVIVISLLLLTACNLPMQQSGVTQDVVATRVAATLTSVHSQIPSEAAATEMLPTVALMTDTPAATATPTVTPTVTPTSTPTTPPEDPKLSLGAPDYRFAVPVNGDPFGINKLADDDPAARYAYSADGLVFISKTTNLGKRWRLTVPNVANLYLEGTFKVTNCSGIDNYGLVLRVPTYNDFTGYYVGLSCGGNYYVDRLDAAGTGYTVIDWTSDTHIHAGTNQTNRLGVWLTGNQFKIYINGNLVKEFSNDAIGAHGHVGAFISARENSNFTVSLQELLEWDQ